MPSSNNSDSPGPRPSRYESQKRRDWNTFRQYLRNHRPPLELSRCSGAHVLEFLRYLDQFGKTKVHNLGCPFFGHPTPPGPCPCPLKQAWGSLDALVGRLRAAFEEDGGRPEANPFGARAVRLYLREVRDSQAKARGIAYEKKRRKRPPTSTGNNLAQQQQQPPQQPVHNVQFEHYSEHAPVSVSVSEGDAKPLLIGRPQQSYLAGTDLNLVINPHAFFYGGNPHHHHHHHHDFMMVHEGLNDGGGGGNASVVMSTVAAPEPPHGAGCNMLPLSVFN